MIADDELNNHEYFPLSGVLPWRRDDAGHGGRVRTRVAPIRPPGPCRGARSVTHHSLLSGRNNILAASTSIPALLPVVHLAIVMCDV